MTVDPQAYIIKLNMIIEPNVRLIRVAPTNLKITLGYILASLSSLCWIDSLATYLQEGYRVRAEGTIEKLNDLFKESITSNLKSEMGEYVVSELSRSSVVNSLHYTDIPLGELFKEQKSGNPGFDFFAANGNILLFGEAKYRSNHNAYSSAFEQINRFVSEKRDQADIPDLQSIVDSEVLIKASQGDRGFIGGFSSTAISNDVLERHIKNDEHYKSLPKTHEIICVAVDIQ
ncbi:MAG: hypothetical protein IKG84_06575 [Bacteroidales bacterium]|nr:hypothetical protein [Bacteroidales bacterium]